MRYVVAKICGRRARVTPKNGGEQFILHCSKFEDHIDSENSTTRRHFDMKHMKGWYSKRDMPRSSRN